MEVRGNKTVDAVDRSFTILETLRTREGARISELSESLNMSASSIHSHLTTLRKNGYVVKRGDAYDIGFKFLDFTRYVKRRNKTFRVAKDRVKDLAHETGEVASIMAEDHGIGYFIFGRRGESTTLPNTEGKRAKLHTVAPGKVLLAHMPQARVEEIIADQGLTKSTDNTISDKEELYQELEAIETSGVAFNRGEFIIGLHAVSVPLRGADNRVIAALSVYGPSHRMQGQYFTKELPEMLLEYANDIHLEVKYGDT